MRIDQTSNKDFGITALISKIDSKEKEYIIFSAFGGIGEITEKLYKYLFLI